MTAQTKERLFHHVTISVFCKPHDEREAVLHGLDVISPMPTATLLAQEVEHDPERPHTVHYRMPDVELTVQDTPSDEGKLTIYTLFFKRMSWVNHFAHRLQECMTDEERAEFHSQPDLLLDADGRLSLRLDKELLMTDKLSLTEDGQCYQVKASVAAYPKTSERILEAVKKILEKE